MEFDKNLNVQLFMYFIEQLQDLYSVCLGWGQFIAEVIGLLILGGVAVRSTTIARIVLL